MRRATWTAVLWTVVTLALPGALAGMTAAEPVLDRLRILVGEAVVYAPAGIVDLVAIGLGVALVIAGLVGVDPGRRAAQTVRRLARRGMPVAGIARQTGLAQDVVHVLVHAPGRDFRPPPARFAGR